MVSQHHRSFFQMGAAEMAGGVASGLFSSQEIVEALIARIEERDQLIKAVAVPLFNQARRTATKLDREVRSGSRIGRLHGVPVTIKESIEVAGTPCTWGVRSRLDHLANQNDPVIDKLQDHGAILLGKTNVMELLMGCECVNPVYGRSLNPWNHAKTPGGSSGGEGAIIAYGGSPLGMGTDIGGSIRTPAHFCGIHGIKPTPGRIATRPPQGIYHVQKAGNVMSSIGPMARFVDDLTLALQVVTEQTEQTEQYPIAPEQIDLSRLRVGYILDDGILPVAPAIARTIQEAAAALKASGAEVVEFKPPHIREMFTGFYSILLADGGQGLRRTLHEQIESPHLQKVHKVQSIKPSLRPIISGILRLLGQRTVGELIFPHVGAKTEEMIDRLVQARALHQQTFIQEWRNQQIDVLICPPFITTALGHDASLNLSFEGSYGCLFNYLQMPAGVVSLSQVRTEEARERQQSKDRVIQTLSHNERESAGLPVGVQIVAPHYREDLVLAVMKALETAFQGKADYPAGKLCCQ
ncbi:amidase [Brevibacillus ginsengisoli]|uniref:amidase n=1 Tax=Brevibacillus ginsengisoli TaxID=363854 RepID=UPI003CEF40E2